MSRYTLRGLQVLADLAVLVVAYVSAYLLRFEFDLELLVAKKLFFTLPYVVLLQYVIFVLFGVPRMAWRYVSLFEVGRIATAALVAVAILTALRLGLASVGGHAIYVVIPLGVIGIDGLGVVVGACGVRMLRRMLSEWEERSRMDAQAGQAPKRVLLIGAGRAGALIAREVMQRPDISLRAVAFVDDDRAKQGSSIQGLRVVGTTADIPYLAKKHRLQQAIICMAEAPSATVRRVVEVCKEAAIEVRIIPGVYQLVDGQVSVSRVREVTIEDLLGREVARLDVDKIRGFLLDQAVAVTGAGGSIGSELCRRVAAYKPSRLILVEHSENALYEIDRELREHFPDVPRVPCLCDIRDLDRLEKVFAAQRPDVVFHAAAYKHVPMMEANPGQAILNNVFGTKNVADTAVRFGAKAFVMISTDKAVNPTSIMGATKRIAEMYVQGLNETARTKFVAVRFGNVLGSNGSVIPLFRRQIAAGGPVTVTHPEMQRYFMTIPEATQLVMQAGAQGQGGEIFLLDMGEPTKIVDLAREMIRLSGFSLDEVPIVFSGVRPGEKLFEELSTNAAAMGVTEHPKILYAKADAFPLQQTSDGMNELLHCDLQSTEAVRKAIAHLVPEFRPPHQDSDTLAAEAAAPRPRRYSVNQALGPVAS